MTGKNTLSICRLPHVRYVLFLVIFAVSLWPLSLTVPWVIAIIGAFDLAVMGFVLSCVPLWRDGNAAIMRRQAKRDDVGQVLLLFLSALISTVILVALGTLVLASKTLSGRDIALLVVTLLACWIFANLIYAFHYARQFYASDNGGDRKGIDFPGDGIPGFSDFVNFAFVIGMTCQTADINITSSSIRKVSTFHSLFAFAFNLGILALTVNVLASTSGGG